MDMYKKVCAGTLAVWAIAEIVLKLRRMRISKYRKELVIIMPNEQARDGMIFVSGPIKAQSYEGMTESMFGINKQCLVLKREVQKCIVDEISNKTVWIPCRGDSRNPNIEFFDSEIPAKGVLKIGNLTIDRGVIERIRAYESVKPMMPSGDFVESYSKRKFKLEIDNQFYYLCKGGNNGFSKSNDGSYKIQYSCIPHEQTVSLIGTSRDQKIEASNILLVQEGVRGPTKMFDDYDYPLIIRQRIVRVSVALSFLLQLAYYYHYEKIN